MKQKPPFIPGTRQVYVLPTAAGGFLALILLVSLLASLNDNNNLGLLLTFFLFSMALVSIVSTQRNLKGLEVRRLSCPPVFAGEPVRIDLTLFSPGRARAGLLLRQGRHLSAMARLEKNETATLRLHLPPCGRGLFRQPKLHLESRAPLGLFRAWIPLGETTGIVVYPAPLSGPLPWTAGHGSDGAASQSPMNAAGSEDFTGHKAYAPGDPLSRVDWKILSRNRGLHIKTFGGPARNLLLDFNDFRDMDTETRLSRLCHAVILAASSGLVFGLRLPGKEIPADGAPGHRERCLLALASFGDPQPLETRLLNLLHAMEGEDHALILQ